MTIVAIGILAVLLPLALYDAVFSPTIARLGLRNVARRKGEAAFVVGGSMLATALITASLIVGDSFGQSIRNVAKDGWGPIDQVIAVDDPALLEATRERVATLDAPIDGVAVARFTDVAVRSIEGVVDAQVRFVETDLGELSAFGGDPAATGFAAVADRIGPEGLAGDEVVVNHRLAEDLRVTTGDAVDLFVAGDHRRFTVVAVADQAGIAGFAAIVGAPGALLDTVPDGRGVTNAIVVSNSGGVFAGADHTGDVVHAVQREFGDQVTIDGVKQALLEDAEVESVEIKAMFGTIGGFSVAAGVLLVVNLFVMLASERKTELGLLRAVGIKRTQVLRAFALEGAVYGALAAAVGALAGIGVGAAVIGFGNGLVDDGAVTLSLAVVPSSVLAGAAIGLAISQLTVVLTSVRLSKVNIVRALKDQAEPTSARQRLRTTVIGSSAAALGGVLFLLLGGHPVVAMAAPVLVLVGVIPAVSRLAPPRLATATLSGAAIAWPALVFQVMPDVMDDPDVSIFLLQGILLVGLATIFVAALAPVWIGLARRLSGGGVASRLGLAHPLDRPVRTALLVAMYSLVIFTVTFMAVMNSVFKASTPTMAFQAGGDYDLVLELSPTADVSTAQLTARADVAAAVPIRQGEVSLAAPASTDGWGFEASFLPVGFDDVATPALTDRAADFADDASAWSAVIDGTAAGDHWVLVPTEEGWDAGDTVELSVPGRSSAHAVEAVVAGTTDLQWLIDAGVLGSTALADQLAIDEPMTRHYVLAADGFAADAVAAALESAYVESGADATTFLARATEEVAGQEAFLQLLQGYLGLGLLIGIAGLGVVLARAVHERRQQIGMLRAVGFPGAVTRRAFLLEAAFIGLQGVLLGIGLGVLSSWQTLTQSTAFEDNLTFDVPRTALLALAVGCLVASLGSAVVPAIRSGRVSPAAALRH